MSGEPLAATVVIPARDAAHCVGAAVRAVRDQRDAEGRGVRVIVVDDGSVDDTAAVARAAGAEVLRGAGEGPAKARNLGVAAAASDLIVFVDADCTPRPGFLAALLEPFADAQVGGVKGAYETEQRELVARFVQIEYEERYARMARRRWIDFVDTYAAAYRREVLEEVGGFDERYRLPSTEDQELSFRVVERGYRLCFVAQARVGHLHAASLWGYARKKAKIGYYKVATLRRHPGKALEDSHTPGTLKAQLLLAPLAAVPLLGAPAALTFLASALPLTRRALRRDPMVGLVAPGLIFVRALALGAGVVAGGLAELGGAGVLPSAERA
ncbi:MAG TPA: glycosyl transferase family 2 [Planctomycetes bacterium]|nr:glycosyl transferase family 2 [Planctomycetota bacterium]